MFKKHQNPDLYKEVKQSISRVGEFVETHVYKVPGVPGKHTYSNLEFNPEEALVVGATTGNLKNTPQTTSVEFSFKDDAVQKITDPFLINPEGVQKSHMIFKPDAPYQQMMELSGGGPHQTH